MLDLVKNLRNHSWFVFLCVTAAWLCARYGRPELADPIRTWTLVFVVLWLRGTASGAEARAFRRIILRLLADAEGPIGGLDLIERSDKKLPYGTIYTHLARLEEKGLITGETLPPNPSLRRGSYGKRVYTITNSGLREAGGRQTDTYRD